MHSANIFRLRPLSVAVHLGRSFHRSSHIPCQGSPDKASNNEMNEKKTSSLTHSRKRSKSVFRLLNSSGGTRHGLPVRAIQRIASRNSRLSLPLRLERLVYRGFVAPSVPHANRNHTPRRHSSLLSKGSLNQMTTDLGSPILNRP